MAFVSILPQYRQDKSSFCFSISCPQTVKYGDILDNSLEIATQDVDFAAIYLSESLALIKVMNKGNTRLREEALAIIEKGLKSRDP